MYSNYDIIKEAILQKRQINAYYNKHYREMCPHVIGLKNGVPHALFYQFGGTSSSELAPIGSPDNWRCIFVDKLSEVESKEGSWYTAPNHSRPQTCVDQIDVEVEY